MRRPDMTGLVQAVWLGLSAVLFVLWLRAMVQGLFALARAARQAAEARGGIWPGPRAQLAEFRRFVTDPAHRRARWQLAGLTAGLLAMYLLGLALWAARPP